MVQMMGPGGIGSRRRYLAEQAAFMEEVFGKAEGFTTPITKPVASFKAPTGALGASKPKVAALKPTGNTLPSASQRLSALRENMQAKIGQTTASSGAPAAVGTTGVGKRESKRSDHLMAGVGGAGVLAATQAEPARNKINSGYRKGKLVQAREAEQKKRAYQAWKKPSPKANPFWGLLPGNADRTAAHRGLITGRTRGAQRRFEARHVTAQLKEHEGRINELRRLANRGLISGRQRLAFQAAAGGGGALLAYAGLRRAAVNKRMTQRDVDSLALGATGGVALHQGSYVPTKLLDNRAERKISRDETAQSRVASHRKAHGLDGAKAGDPRWKGYFRSYPTDVPGGKMKRALAYTHSGKSGVVTGGLTIGAAALGTERLRRGGKFQSQKASRLAKEPVQNDVSVAKREPLKTSINEDDARKLVDRHGLTGPLPKHLDREQRMAAYEARYVSAGGHRAEKWQHRAQVADKIKTGGLAVATAGGAGWLATRGKIKGKTLSPKIRHHAETVAGAGATAGGAGELYAGHARRKRSSYASAPAGVAASALRRMQDYS